VTAAATVNVLAAELAASLPDATLRETFLRGVAAQL
jgi:hypothetical protein